MPVTSLTPNTLKSPHQPGKDKGLTFGQSLQGIIVNNEQIKVIDEIIHLRPKIAGYNSSDPLAVRGSLGEFLWKDP